VLTVNTLRSYRRQLWLRRYAQASLADTHEKALLIREVSVPDDLITSRFGGMSVCNERCVFFCCAVGFGVSPTLRLWCDLHCVCSTSRFGVMSVCNACGEGGGSRSRSCAVCFLLLYGFWCLPMDALCVCGVALSAV
jgi:hypothetical protein